MRISILLICITALIITSCNSESHKNPEAATYTVSLPVKKDTIINNEFIAQIRAYQHIELRALDEGYLKKVYVDEGQFVKKGQLLFQLMPTIYEAEKQKSLAEYNKAKIEYQNTKSLADNNIVSKNELALSKATLDKAKAELSLAEAHLQFTQIRAPFDGIIGRFNEVREGSLLEEGELLTTLSDNNKMWVYFNVPESVYLDFVRKQSFKNKKQEVQLQLADGLMYPLAGLVETIESDFNNETGNIAFRATFVNRKTILRHGQTGKVYLASELKNALLIPQKATYEVLNKKFVFLIKNGKARAQEIVVHNEMPHLYHVTKGVTEKDTILIEGLRKVKNGDKVSGRYLPLKKIIQELASIKAE